jgi:ABC-type glutathione transport system ATPase component
MNSISQTGISKAEFIQQLNTSSSLTAESVSKSFIRHFSVNGKLLKDTIFYDLNFSISTGTIVGLMGRTGAGKTTLGKIISGLLKPDHGKIIIGKIDLLDNHQRYTAEIRKRIRFVPQNPDAVLPTYLLVSKALKEARLLSCLSKSEMRDWQDFIQNEFLCHPSWMKKEIGELSIGQKRRVINYRAIQACPKYLILDEPFNGLDVISKYEFLSLLRSICDNWSIGILIISHDEQAMQHVSDVIWNMADGMLTKYWSKPKE